MCNEFYFNAVGQGLFYSGSLFGGAYNFVYDCGTDSSSEYLSGAIQDVCNNRLHGKKTIDFVMISHLHKDHFSGLSELMSNAHVKKVYLPYLGDGNDTLKKFLIAREVVFLPTEGSEENNYSNREALYYRVYNLYSGRQRETEVEFIGQEPYKRNDENAIAYSKGAFYDSAEMRWCFSYFNMRASDAKLNDLNAQIEAEMERNGVDKIEKLLFDPNGIDIIQDIYKNVFGDGKQNLTSTVLVHYPLDIFTGLCFCNYDAPDYYPYPDGIYENPCDKTVVTVLTGDAEFDDEMLATLADILEYTGLKILQVPHHGSSKNWKTLAYLRDNFNAYVASFGLGNKYHHPNTDVVTDVTLKYKRPLFISTQTTARMYVIYTSRR
ncbi:MAG: MBL fold metallo-hydrolase [Clostridia bacterium]|nr:MBL fold metallo-hydrolase [Clostridia bacterium]